MKNFMWIAWIRVVAVLMSAMLLPGDMVAAGQAAQQRQLAFNARAPHVETLTLDAPVLPGAPAIREGNVPAGNVAPVVVEPVIVPSAATPSVVSPVIVPVGAKKIEPVVIQPVSVASVAAVSSGTSDSSGVAPVVVPSVALASVTPQPAQSANSAVQAVNNVTAPIKPVVIEPVVPVAAPVVPAVKAVAPVLVEAPIVSQAVQSVSSVVAPVVVHEDLQVAAPIKPVNGSAGASVVVAQPAVSVQAPAVVEVASAPVASVPAAMPMPAVVDLNTKIKQLYSTMQSAQNKTYDAATYANFGASLVSVFNEAVETQSYMIQLLNAASATPLLNAEQQNYVRNAMIPNLDQIDESTKPLPAGKTGKVPSRAEVQAAGHAVGAGDVVTTTPGGKKKRKKGKKHGVAAVAATGPATHGGATAKPHKKGKKHVQKHGVDATAGVAVAVPVVGAAKPVAHAGAKKKGKNNKAQNAHVAPAVTVPDSTAPVVVTSGGAGGDDGDIII